MTRKPTIWIVNESGHAYHKALDVVPNGSLKPLTVGNVNPFRLDRLAADLSRGIVKYSSPDDYVLISGTPILNSLVIYVWLIYHKHCKLLQWNAKSRTYVLSTVTKENLDYLIEKEIVH